MRQTSGKCRNSIMVKITPGPGPSGDFVADEMMHVQVSFCIVCRCAAPFLFPPPPPVFFLFCSYHDPLVIVAVQSSQVSACLRQAAAAFCKCSCHSAILRSERGKEAWESRALCQVRFAFVVVVSRLKDPFSPGVAPAQCSAVGEPLSRCNHISPMKYPLRQVQNFPTVKFHKHSITTT